jgi:dTDP-4-dehydrorhamnose reductase
MAAAAQACGAWMVHYSSDYVFDGSGSRPWQEGDAPAPLNVYGHTKLEGERLVVAACSKHLILRTSWVYGVRGGNFARTMLRLAAEREQLTVIDDQIGAPTGADLLADVTAHALRACARDASLSGVYHAAAAGETSWNGYARFVIGEAVKAGRLLKAGVDGIAPVPSSAYPTAARRPHNSRLATGKLEAAFGLSLPAWQQGVSRMISKTR